MEVRGATYQIMEGRSLHEANMVHRMSDTRTRNANTRSSRSA
jgi:hypothetical protein